MDSYKWREGIGVYRNVDADKVASELLGLAATEGLDEYKSLPAKDIVNLARDNSLEIHKCFEWDDSKAAEKYRERQARDVIHLLVIKEETVPKDRPEVCVFQLVEKGHGYLPTRYIVKQEDKYQELLKKAYAELRAFKEKYSMLTELKEILDMID